MIALEGVNGESLVNLFRTLSQRRRHGIVAISHADSFYEVLFHDGKIVGAAAGNQPIVHSVLSRLKRAGLFVGVELPDHLEHSPGAEPGQIDVVRQAISYIRQTYPAQSIDDFIRAKQASEIDLLHMLSSVEEASARFNPQGMQIDQSVSISISPGQLLLDLVDLAEERRRLSQLAGGLNPDDLIVTRVGAATPSGLSAAERALWDCLSEERPLGDLFCRLLISRHAVCERLFALVDRGGAVIEKPKAGSRPPVEQFRSSPRATAENQTDPSDLFQALDGSDSSLDDEISSLSLLSDVESPSGNSLALAGEVVADYSTLREVISAIDRSSEVLRNVAGESFPEREASAQDEIGPITSDSEEESSDHEPTGVDSALQELLDSDPEFEKALFGPGGQFASAEDDAHLPPESFALPVDSKAEELPKEPRSISFQWLSQFELRDLNFFLLDPQNAQLIALSISLIFLAAILFLGYPLIDSWFESLTNFTLNVR